MAEDLQSLIDRIQKDAVGKAETEAQAIIANAKAQAAEIVKSAETEARTKLEKADTEAKAFEERSERTLEQAARDLLLTIGKNLEKMLLDILSLEVEKSLSEDTIKAMLLTLSKSYASDDVAVVFSDADAKKLASFITGEFSKKLSKGAVVESDSSVRFGFRVKLDGGKVTQEFTKEAMAEALSALLRPQIAKIVSNAAQGK